MTAPTTCTTRTNKPTVTLPTPERMTRSMYYVPSFDMARRANGVKYAVTLTERGWRCSNRWCNNPYGCTHVERLADWLLEQEIIAMLPEPTTPAKRRIAEERANTLISCFDYSKPSPKGVKPEPTYVVLERHSKRG